MKIHYCYFLILGIFVACSPRPVASNNLYTYTPDSQELHDKIVAMDSIFFNAYNTCNLVVMEKLYSDSIEFYHDKGGLTTSKPEIMEATKRNVCGRVSRELVKGSLEVYPIHNYGAIEMGIHKFHNNQEPNAISHPGKFIIIWQQKGSEWVIRRVVSLH